MQTAPGVAAILNPFAAAAGASQAPGQATGLADFGGLFGEAAEGEQEQTEGFGQALDAALAAALAAPLPVAPLQAAPAAPQGTAADQPKAEPALDGGRSAFLAGLMETAVAPTPAPTELETTSELLGASAALQPAALAEGAPTGAAPFADPAASAKLNEAGPQPSQPLQHAQVASPRAPAANPAATAPTAATAATPALAAALDAGATLPSPPMQADAQAAAPATAPAATAAPVAALVTAQAAPTNAAQSTKTQAPSAEPATKAAKTRTTTASGEARTAEPHAALASGNSDTAASADLDASSVVDAAVLADDGEAQGQDADLDQPTSANAPHGLAEHRAVQSAPAEVARATPQTVAHLAAQIANKVEGKATRFDVQLDPHGLGKVEVKVEIGARGDISAALTFENPQSAAELRGKANELHAALEQAGFDLSKTTLSFSSGDQGQQQGLFGQQQQQNNTPLWRGRAFTDLSDIPEAAPAPVQRRAAAGGVDVRI